MTEKMERRRFIKYVGAGIVVVAAAGAGYYVYQTSQPTTPTTTPTTTATTPTLTTMTTMKPTVEIAFLSPDPVATVVLSQADDLEKKYGIRPKVIKTSISEHNEKMMLALTSHAGDVDIIEQMVEHVGQNHTYYVPMGDRIKDLGVDLNDFCEFALQASGYYDDAHKFSPRGGGSVLYNLPTGAEIDLYTYRRDWFEDPKEQAAFKDKYGYDLMPPEDGYAWKEFCDVLEFFTRATENKWGYTEAADPREMVVTTRPEAFGLGVYYTDRNGVPSFNLPLNIEALSLHQHWYKQGWVAPGTLIATVQEADKPFLDGKAAIVLNWNHYAGELEKEGSPVKGKTSQMMPPYWKEPRGKPRPLPPGVTSWAKPGSISRTNTGGWNMGINKDSKHIDEAFLFVKWYFSREVGYNGAMETGYLPASNSVYDIPELQKKFPYTVAARKIWSGDHGWTCIPRLPEMGAMYDATTHLIQEAVSKFRDPKEVLDECQAAVVEIWKKAGYPTEGEYAPW